LTSSSASTGTGAEPGTRSQNRLAGTGAAGALLRRAAAGVHDAAGQGGGPAAGRAHRPRRGVPPRRRAYDRYYGDPRVRPNPNLAPLASAPFYAAKIVPGDLGTKGGLRTDGRARVLRTDGTPIPGLYAAGNASASVMGHSYAGAGATIGPAMTFGYIAALDLTPDAT
jgi:succinate dehydrogenase/fumarate reductase flavoprotein subunit